MAESGLSGEEEEEMARQGLGEFWDDGDICSVLVIRVDGCILLKAFQVPH